MSRIPIYEQLVEKYKEFIIKEILKPNEQLPSVRTLAGQLAINPNTIQKAYAVLEQQKYIYSVPGKGNFVANVKQKPDLEKINKLEKQLSKIITEMLFLGVTKEEIYDLIQKVSQSSGGVKNK